jgi:hypothetical protein
MVRSRYRKPSIETTVAFESTALACAKTTDPPPGSWHTSAAYDTFTGHFGGGWGGSESNSGAAGIGFGPGGTSGSGLYSGMCGNWILYSS